MRMCVCVCVHAYACVRVCVVYSYIHRSICAGLSSESTWLLRAAVRLTLNLNLCIFVTELSIIAARECQMEISPILIPSNPNVKLIPQASCL